jgi:hypothetical protein
MLGEPALEDQLQLVVSSVHVTAEAIVVHPMLNVVEAMYAAKDNALDLVNVVVRK